MTHEERKRRRAEIGRFCRRNSAVVAADKFGVSMAMVRTACREHGVTPRRVMPESNVAQPNTFRILKLLIAGKSASTIARKFYISSQRVYQIKERAIQAGFDL